MAYFQSNNNMGSIPVNRTKSQFCTVFRTNIGPHHDSYTTSTGSNGGGSYYHPTSGGMMSNHSSRAFKQQTTTTSNSFQQRQPTTMYNTIGSSKHHSTSTTTGGAADLDKLLDDLLGVAKAAGVPSPAPSQSYIHTTSYNQQPPYTTSSNTFNSFHKDRSSREQQHYVFNKTYEPNRQVPGNKFSNVFETERERYLSRELRKTQKKLSKLRRAASECGYDLEEERRFDFSGGGRGFSQGQQAMQTTQHQSGANTSEQEYYHKGRSRRHSDTQHQHDQAYRFMSEEPVVLETNRRYFTTSTSGSNRPQQQYHQHTDQHHQKQQYSTMPTRRVEQHTTHQDNRDTFDSKLMQLERSLDRARDRIRVVSGDNSTVPARVQRYGSAIDMHTRDQQHLNHRTATSHNYQSDPVNFTYQEKTVVHEPSDVYQEIETITLQPIGKGIHDLEANKTLLTNRKQKILTQSVPHLATMQPYQSATVGRTTPALSNRRAATLRSSTPQPTNTQCFQPTSLPRQESHGTKHYQTNQSQEHHRVMVHAGSLPPNLTAANDQEINRHQYYDTPDISLRQNTSSHQQQSRTHSFKESVSHQQAETSHQVNGRAPAQLKSPLILQTDNIQSVPIQITNDPMSPGGVSTSTNFSSITNDSVLAGGGLAAETMQLWYKPSISRDEAINQLRNSPPGSFVVRDSNSFPGAFGLAVRVAQIPRGIQPKSSDLTAELVRHFLIEPSEGGVRLKGCANEPVFRTLSALVQQHSITQLALPCKLLLPTATDTLLKQGAACNVLYLGSVDVGHKTGREALGQATDVLLRNRGSLRTTETQLKVTSDCLTLTDLQRKLFFRKQFPSNSILYCDMDPADRRYCYAEATVAGVLQPKIFGFISRKSTATDDNVCTVVCELDPKQPASAVVTFVGRYLMPRT